MKQYSLREIREHRANGEHGYCDRCLDRKRFHWMIRRNTLGAIPILKRSREIEYERMISASNCEILEFGFSFPFIEKPAIFPFIENN